MSERDWGNAHLINAALDVHRDDPTFGYRFIKDELETLGMVASENRVNRLCTTQKIWSIHARKRDLSRKAGPPVHDDLIQKDFTADRPNHKWLTDITDTHQAKENFTFAWSKTCGQTGSLATQPAIE
jgi:putative transposase